MKRNRLLIFGIAILILLVGAMLLSACGHTHQVLRWKVIKEPTCTHEGMQRGACVDCGEVAEEPVAIVPENHVWGIWEVTVVPTYERNGRGEATRVCKEDSTHTQSVVLPRLTADGTGYKEYEVYQEATVVSEGRLSAVLESEYGEIAFTIEVPKKEFDLDSVEDAVYIGSSNKHLIRQGSGLIDIGYNPGKEEHTYGAFTYEYGNDYLHINDTGKRRETWISKTSSGDYFGVLKDEYAVNDIIRFSATELQMGGYFYELSRSDKEFYGAEGLLYNAYLWGKRTTQRDFKSGKTVSAVKDTSGNVINASGESVYWFKFSYYYAPQYYNDVECRFMLTESGAIKYIVMYVNSYTRDPSGKGQSADQFGLYADPNTNSSIAYLYGNCGNPLYNEVIEYKQDLVENYPDEPEHNYTEEAFMISSFDVKYRGKVVGEEYDENTTPSFKTGGYSNNIVLEIGNILPATANLDTDPISIYRIDGNREILLTSSDTNDPVWINGSNRVTIRSRLAGEIKLVFRSRSKTERVVTLYAEYSSPETLYPCVYEYNDAGYSWRQSEDKKLSTTVYVKQSLLMRAVISSEYLAYVDPSYTPQIASGPEGGATLTQSEDGETVSFVATQAGEYVVEMRSKLMSTVVARVIVTVESAPNVNSLLSGEYTAKFKKFTATVSFAEPDTEGRIYATVTTNKGTEVLLVYYNWGYGAIMCEHSDGANLDVLININEAYKLVLSNPTGFGGGREKAIMYEKVDEPVDGSIDESIV